MTQPLPLTTATLYQLADGTFSEDPAAGGTAVQVPVTDLVCVDDLDPFGGETTSDLQGLAQDVYHIFLEVLGSNLDDTSRGLGVEGYLSGTTADLQALAALADSELRKDDRIDSSTTTFRLQPDGSYRIDCQIIADGALLPLQFSYTKLQGLQVVGQQ